MKGLTKRSVARGILPYATTILSISLAATLRVEHACSDGERPMHDPPALYPIPAVASTLHSGYPNLAVKFNSPRTQVGR